eukprot:1186114-Prorocentrum_minimum.AAC.5
MCVGQAGGHSTLLIGATASGELLPSTLIIFTSAAKKASVLKVVLGKLPKFNGKFGKPEDNKRYTMRVAASKKGGTTAELFRGFLKDTAEKLFPDRSPTIININDREVSNKVVLKVDGGPGRVDFETLKLANQLFVDLFSGYPNGSGWNQEMVRTPRNRVQMVCGLIRPCAGENVGAGVCFLLIEHLPKKVHTTNQAD